MRVNMFINTHNPYNLWVVFTRPVLFSLHVCLFFHINWITQKISVYYTTIKGRIQSKHNIKILKWATYMYYYKESLQQYPNEKYPHLSNTLTIISLGTLILKLNSFCKFEFTM